MELQDVKYNRGQERIERLGSALVNARLTELDPADFLERHRNVRDVTVDFREPQVAVIRARPVFEGVQLPQGATVDLRGQVVPEDGRINFAVSEVRAAGIDLGQSAAARISRAINPLVDLSGLPVPLQITGVEVQDNGLRLNAMARQGPVQLGRAGR